MKDKITVFTKIILDIMFFGGMVVTLSLPYTLHVLGKYLEKFQKHYAELVVIYFILGILALFIIRELRKMFRTVLKDDCFVKENVVSLQKMSIYSFLIVMVSIIRTVVYQTPAMFVVILVFCIAGLFSRVLSMVFDKAIEYKQETDLTI